MDWASGNLFGPRNSLGSTYKYQHYRLERGGRFGGCGYKPKPGNQKEAAAEL